jgi:cytochrome b involved in lipid metabolism
MGNSNKKYYTLEEVKKHDTIDSSWLICGNKIYNVTNYISIHPGGSNSIFQFTGTDIDCKKHYKFHSNFAKHEWDKMLIGYLKNK